MVTAADDLTLAIQRFPLGDYLVQFGGEREGKEVMLDCPRCGKHHLTVSIPKRQWRCFTCQRFHALLDPQGRKVTIEGGGGVFGLVQWLEGCDKRTAAQRILQQAARVMPKPGQLETIAPAAARVAQKQPCGLPKNAVDLDGTLPYMDRRGITLFDFKQFGLRYVPRDGSWLQDRLLFPVWNRGVCLYWQARACWDEHEHRPRWPGDKFRKSLNPSSERDGVLYLGSGDVLGNL